MHKVNRIRQRQKQGCVELCRKCSGTGKVVLEKDGFATVVQCPECKGRCAV